MKVTMIPTITNSPKGIITLKNFSKFICKHARMETEAIMVNENQQLAITAALAESTRYPFVLGDKSNI
jgi:hypothetical protein